MASVEKTHQVVVWMICRFHADKKKTYTKIAFKYNYVLGIPELKVEKFNDFIINESFTTPYLKICWMLPLKED